MPDNTQTLFVTASKHAVAMQSNTAKAAEVIANAANLSVYTHVTQGKWEMEMHDYDVSDSGNIRFERGTDDEDTMAEISVSGGSSSVSLWVTKEDALALSDVFADLASDIEQRE